MSLIPLTLAVGDCYNQGLIDSKEKRACNLVYVPIKIRTEAKNSNKLCISYGTKTAKVTKNIIVPFLYCMG